jgi:hypothetical protein
MGFFIIRFAMVSKSMRAQRSRIDHVRACVGRRRRDMPDDRHDLQSRRGDTARRRGKPAA